MEGILMQEQEEQGGEEVVVDEHEVPDDYPVPGQQDFWFKVIDIAEERGRFTEDEQTLAGVWPTCACGHQDDGLQYQKWNGLPSRTSRRLGPLVPDDSSIDLCRGPPTDDILREAGGMFYKHVIGDRFDSARRCLEQIENRAAELLTGEA